jgi:hypothetical protein
MPFNSNQKDNELYKFQEDINGNAAVRVILTEGKAEDAPAPTNLELSNNVVQENLPVGEVVGTLSVTGGLAPIVFTIDQDLGNAFQIVGNELQTSRVLSSASEPILNVAIRATDNNGSFTTKNFTITVTQVEGFINQKSYEFNGTDSFIIYPERLHANGTTQQPRASIGFWAKIDNFTSTATIFSTKAADNVSGIHFKLTGQFNRFEVSATKDNGNTRTYRYAPPTGFNAGDWNFYGIVYDRDINDILLFINAIERLPSATISNDSITSSSFNDNDTYIGRSPTGGGYLQGRIDEFFVSSEALEPTDWVLAYNGGISPNLDNLPITLEHWYRAEDDQLPIILDVKGNTNGAETNVTIANDSASEFSNNFSVSFDGVSNYFIGSGTIDFTQANTISFWINRATPLQTDLLFAWNATTNTDNNAARIYMDNNSAQRIYFRIDSPSGDIVRRWSLDASSLNTWNHIVITGSDFTDANTIQLYRNGILLSANQTTNTLVTLPSLADKFAIGGGITGGSLYNGLIDEYAVFTGVAANQSQVEELFNLGSPSDLRSTSIADDLTFWYRFGDRNAQGSVMSNEVGSEAVVMLNYDPSFYVGSTP